MIFIDFKLAFGSDFNLASYGSMGFWNLKWLRSFSVVGFCFCFLILLLHFRICWLLNLWFLLKFTSLWEFPGGLGSEGYGLPLPDSGSIPGQGAEILQALQGQKDKEV